MSNTTACDSTIALLDRALRDLEPLNPAAQELLRRCHDMTFATEVFTYITGWNAALIAAIDHEGHLEKYDLSQAVERCLADGLGPLDSAAYKRVFDEAVALAWEDPEGIDLNFVANHPSPRDVIAAAYALAWDLGDVTFDCGPDCTCAD